MPLGEVALGATLKAGGDWINEIRKTARGDKVTIDDSAARESMVHHIANIEKWSATISMLNLRREKRLADAFVELSLDIGLTRYSWPSEKPKTTTVEELFRMPDHVAILGRPGAGKTTSLQKIAQLAIAAREAGRGGVPLLVTLRDLRAGDGLVSYVLAKIGVAVKFGGRETAVARREWEQRVLNGYLERVSAVLLVDGLDEVDASARSQVEYELREIALAPGTQRMFVTCRTAEYTGAIKGVQPFTILPLSEQKVQTFAAQWLGAERAPAFIDAIRVNPHAGTEVVPLTLAHLCALYERDGQLPPRPVDVYEAIVSLLIEEWDRERGVRRTSRYSDFAPRKKERFLEALAFELAMSGRKGSFHHNDARRAYQSIAASFALPAEDEADVLREVESHTGLIVQSGFREYEFVHLVIQEFLSAMHAQRTPNGISHFIPLFPNEMALVTAYSTTAEDYLEEVVRGVLTLGIDDQTQRFVAAYTARLGIENVHIRPSARNGWTLLALLDVLAAHRLPNGRLPSVMPTEIQFFFDASAKESIQMAAALCDRYEETGGIYLIPRQFSGIPPFLVQMLVSRKRGGFRVLHRGAVSLALD